MPVVQVGADRIAGPDDDVFGMKKAFRADACCRAKRQQPRGSRAFATVGTLTDRRTQAVEKGVAAIHAMHEPLVAQIAGGHDGTRTVLCNDRDRKSTRLNSSH